MQVGYGDITPSTATGMIFTIFTMLLGSLLYFSPFSSLAMILLRSSEFFDEFCRYSGFIATITSSVRGEDAIAVTFNKARERRIAFLESRGTPVQLM